MNRLQDIGNRILTVLGAMTVSQRLAVALCAALVGVSLLWLAQWSTQPEMVPLISRDFSLEEISAAEESLRSSGVRHVIRGTRIYVRSGERHNALRVVHAADALPEGSLFDLSDAVKDGNPFVAPEARRNAWNFALGNELAKIIATSPFVQKASVIINPQTRRRLGGIQNVPTASVALTLSPGRELSHEMVEGFAKLVAGAVAGLKPHHVYITDARSGRAFHLPDPENAASFDVLALTHRREAQLRQKILEQLAHIPGAVVAVTVELDTSKRIQTSLKHDRPQPKMERTHLTELGAGTDAMEPGVNANLGTALTAAGGGRSEVSEESTTEFFDPKLTSTETVEQLPFALRKVTAAVGIPQSFILGVFRAQYPQRSDEPKDDDPQLAALREAQVAAVKAGVERIVQAQSPGDVEVDVYPDLFLSGSASGDDDVVMAGQSADSTDLRVWIRTLASQLALFALAVTSLFLLFLMFWTARRTTGAGGAGGGRGPAGTVFDEEPYLAEEVPIVQPTAPGSVLTGREVDPATLRQTQLGQEIESMVRNDPQGAADLLRRWIVENG